MNFLWELAFHDKAKLQLLRVMIYLPLSKKKKGQVAFYLYGSAGRGKSTFVNVISRLLGDNAVPMSLSSWKTAFGKLQAYTAKLLVFDSVDNRGSTSGIVSDFKSYISGGHVEAAERHVKTIQIKGGGLIFFTSNHMWNYKKLDLKDDPGWLRRFIFIPIYPPTLSLKRDVTLEDSLIGDVSGLVNWAQALSPEFVEEICNHAQEISSYFDEQKGILQQDISFLVKKWFYDSVRLDPSSHIYAGFVDTNQTAYTDTLYYNYIQYAEKRSEPFASPTLFKNLMNKMVALLYLPNVTWTSTERGKTLEGLTLDPKQGSAIQPIIPKIITDRENVSLLTYRTEDHTFKNLGKIDNFFSE